VTDAHQQLFSSSRVALSLAPHLQSKANSSLDEYESYLSPVAAATTFLCQLVTSHTKVTFLLILHFVNGILNSHATAPQHFGALNMLSALAPFVMCDVKRKMEDFTMKYVFPKFAVPEGYMHAAIWLSCQYLGVLSLTWYAGKRSCLCGSVQLYNLDQ